MERWPLAGIGDRGHLVRLLDLRCDRVTIDHDLNG